MVFVLYNVFICERLELQCLTLHREENEYQEVVG